MATALGGDGGDGMTAASAGDGGAAASRRWPGDARGERRRPVGRWRRAQRKARRGGSGIFLPSQYMVEPSNYMSSERARGAVGNVIESVSV